MSVVHREIDSKFTTVLEWILQSGNPDVNPRPHWADGTPTHTLSVNHEMLSYDLSKNEWPLITLRPIAYKSAIKELFWIYQDQSNDLNILKDKYGITWWDEWDIGDRTIGSCYGETVRRHHLMDNLLDGLKNDPDGRRHIINLWQEDDFKEKHGLKPCAFMTIWNVVHLPDHDRLDMMLVQRSSDFITAGSINQFQYAVFLKLVATSLGYEPGVFTWVADNIQIYDRHITAAKELLNRSTYDDATNVRVEIPKKDFYDYKPEDIVVTGYNQKAIAVQNPQIKLEVAI